MCDQRANVIFVEEVKKHPLLYDTRLPDYARRDLTDAAWEEVGNEVNLTGAACKEKWKNLKTVYSRHVRRSLEEPSEKRKKYYLMEHMEFILPYMRPSTMFNSVNSNDSNEEWSTSIQQNSCSRPESFEDGQDDDATLPIVTFNTDVKDKVAHNRRKSLKSSDNPDSELCLPSCAKSSQNHFSHRTEEMLKSRHYMNNTLEVRRMFLLGLLDEVGAMTDAQMRLFKRKVLKLIDDVLES